MRGWKFNDDYVACAECEVSRPLGELRYRKFTKPDEQGRLGDYACTDEKWCKAVQTSGRKAVAP